MATGLIEPQAKRDRQADVKPPAHRVVYETIRHAILFGDYKPGQAVTIQGLVRDTGAGMTPVREAIRRLISEGAVVMLDNRRLSVPVLTREDVQQLDFIRNQLEPELASRAAGVIEAPQIETLVQIDTALNEAIERGDIAAYLEHNYAFHRELYAAAQMPILAETVDRMWLRFGPSLRIVCGRVGTHNLPDKHADILDALKSGDAEAAFRATREDIAQGMVQILAAADSIDSP